MVTIRSSCKCLSARRHHSSSEIARFGRLFRLFRARGLTPDVRVRPFRTGEGRPRCGAFTALIFATATPALAEGSLPAEWAVFHDARVEVHPGTTEGAEERWLVLRYIAPEIAREGGSLGYEDVAAGMDALCDGEGLATARAHESPVDQIVITVMDRAMERGQPNPEATQFIATYAVTEAGCAWQ